MADDWCQLEDRIEGESSEIETLARCSEKLNIALRRGVRTAERSDLQSSPLT